MNICKLAEGLYIAPQLTQADAADAAALGIRSVICNRPDGEADDQPAFNQVQQWLAEAGIENTVHQPVVAPAISGQDTARFQALLNQAEKPVLAYCRTGTRSALLWAYHQVQNGLPVAEAVAAAKQAGVDLANFEQRLQEAAANGLPDK
ncbi:TIGR01244 family sulfur transferase [Neisseria dentiae]|uniref:TIGR01244 family sulfur transferase n=1 Tax=Neisseria dentiae TaxID=194197 RepID=UPI00211D0EC6|nr:TIGR01244 family sulfur transferase [Neisseria dentiae]MCQ9326874.1 TIGR01244 family sulfur transferase [Neisseria dentiae]